jgi:hypothetical protein
MWAQQPQRLPVVLTCDEVRRVIAQLQYGAGVRLLNCLRLRSWGALIKRETVSVEILLWTLCYQVCWYVSSSALPPC